MSKKKFSTEYLKKLGLPYDGDVMEDNSTLL